MNLPQKTPNTQNRKREEFPPKTAEHARSLARRSRKQRRIGRKRAQRAQKTNNINSCLCVRYVLLRQNCCQKKEAFQDGAAEGFVFSRLLRLLAAIPLDSRPAHAIAFSARGMTRREIACQPGCKARCAPFRPLAAPARFHAGGKIGRMGGMGVE